MTDVNQEARVDLALVTRVLLSNDQRAFEQLLRRHQGMVRAQLRRLLRGDEAAADDLAQETFVIAWRKLSQFRAEAKFSTWLYRIAYACFLQAMRKKSLPMNAADDVLQQLPAQPLAVDLSMDMARAWQRLSAAEQVVLLHCVQLGMSHAEAAYVLAMPVGTVKTHATRGKAKLKLLLAAWHEEQA
ncbi:MAG: RNA polymerase sigma factor [Xanthomonadales bacterium]|nr:RNA polymerase sigma factor [Xanthomonadales bacterium]